MDWNLKYIQNLSYISVTRDGVTRVISIEVEDSDLIILKGASASVLTLFDGKKNLKEIKSALDEKEGKPGTESDFEKLVEFLLSRKIISPAS